MFCCIYQFAIQAKTNIYQYKDCSNECPYFKDGKCSLLSIKNKKLDKEKFGSILQKTIKLPENYKHRFGNYQIISASLIIHPINSDMWVVKLKNGDKFIYKMIHIGSGARDACDLDDLNNKLKKWVTEDLVDSDFELCN